MRGQWLAQPVFAHRQIYTEIEAIDNILRLYHLLPRDVLKLVSVHYQMCCLARGKIRTSTTKHTAATREDYKFECITRNLPGEIEHLITKHHLLKTGLLELVVLNCILQTLCLSYNTVKLLFMCLYRIININLLKEPDQDKLE